jgi:hypothetical protein
MLRKLIREALRNAYWAGWNEGMKAAGNPHPVVRELREGSTKAEHYATEMAQGLWEDLG